MKKTHREKRNEITTRNSRKGMLKEFNKERLKKRKQSSKTIKQVIKDRDAGQEVAHTDVCTTAFNLRRTIQTSDVMKLVL
jgi:hypothetical protein